MNPTTEMIAIETIYIHLTRKCNLHCKYCYNDSGIAGQTELSTQQFSTFIDDLKSIDVKKIVFTGGEPLLRDDIFELAHKVRSTKKNVLLSISTNGTLITRNSSKMLVNLFDEVRVSIDGPEQINDAIRGDQSFDGAMAALRRITEVKGNPIASITATSLNIDHLNVFLSFLISQGINNIHVSPIKLIGRAKDENLTCDFKQVNNIVNGFLQKNFGISLKRQKGDNNCGVGRYISINPDGSVFPCYMLSFDEMCIGNILIESIISMLKRTQILNSLKTIRFDELNQCEVCYKELSTLTKCSELSNSYTPQSRPLIDFIHEMLTKTIYNPGSNC